MKVITVYILLLSLVFIYNQDYGNKCEDKAIEDPMDEFNGFAGDVTLAHHEVASCASLYPYEEDNNIPQYCCYVKLKYKLEGTKFTRDGDKLIVSNGANSVVVVLNGLVDVDTSNGLVFKSLEDKSELINVKEFNFSLKG